MFAEEDELGDNHGVWPFLRTYSICKIAAEGDGRLGGGAIPAPDHRGPALRPLR